MEAYAPQAWSQIIASAAVSPLGIAALIVLIVGFVILTLFRHEDRPQARFLVIGLLMLFCVALFAGSIYSVRPVAASAVVARGAGEPSPPGENASVPSAANSTSHSASVRTEADENQRLVAPRADCGSSWTGWVNPGAGVGDPCPQSCSRGDELGQSYRLVGFPPRPQTKHKFQCWYR